MHCLLRCECRLLAVNGHANGSAECLLVGEERTWPRPAAMSPNDPKRTDVAKSVLGPFRSALLNRYDALSSALGADMRRSSTAPGKTAKKPPRKRAELRRANKTVRRRMPSVADLQARIDALSRDLAEARDQQTATFEVLKVISSSPGHLEPMFQAVLENAVRICEAKFGTIYLFDGNSFVFGADVGTTPEYGEFQRRRGPFQPMPGTHFDRILQTKQVSHSADAAAEPVKGPVVTIGGARSFVGVPMIKDDVLVGAIGIYRREVRPFTDKHIELVKNFAAQAVIAIEDTRLLNELRQRTDDLTEALEQQTATSEVLKVISSSPGELEPVFNAILKNATRLCDAKFGNLFLYRDEGSTRRPCITHRQRLAEQFQKRMARFRSRAGLASVASCGRKARYTSSTIRLEPHPGPACRYGGARSLVAVPMLKEDKLVGAFIIYRQEVRAFTDKQIELVTNFAAQAVIAIENTRLLNELRQRTDDLTESLEQQTATSEVLQVISSSPGDLEPVFEAMLANATRICEAKFGNLWLREGAQFSPHRPAALRPVFGEH